ncbi:hypothetical protein [Bacillus massiliigorillae]|uniref:hypothetical protein n=1 Tax=Bacillus massiliigorillae TaxID=1243664 RepID=UPI0003A5BA02|nr:hypothetical protein [Bacillus massiliigorillae]
MNNLLSVSDIEKITNIPSSTIRRYVRNHREYIDSKRKGNLHFIYESAIPVLEKIRLHYEEGKNHAEITDILKSDVVDEINRNSSKAVSTNMKKPDVEDIEVMEEIVTRDEGVSNEAVLAIQSSVESIEKKQMQLLEDLMLQVKRVEESKSFAIELLEKQIESKNDRIAELEAKIKGFEIMLSMKEVAATSMDTPQELEATTDEKVVEKKSLYNRLFKINKMMQKNA